MSTSKTCHTFKNEANHMGETDPWAADAAAFTKFNVHVLNGQTKLPKIGYMLMNHACKSKLAGKNTVLLIALVQRHRPQNTSQTLFATQRVLLRTLRAHGASEKFKDMKRNQQLNHMGTPMLSNCVALSCAAFLVRTNLKTG